MEGWTDRPYFIGPFPHVRRFSSPFQAEHLQTALACIFSLIWKRG